jgi:hypothetical protein
MPPKQWSSIVWLGESMLLLDNAGIMYHGWLIRRTEDEEGNQIAPVFSLQYSAMEATEITI